MSSYILGLIMGGSIRSDAMNNGDMLMSEWVRINWHIILDWFYNFTHPTHTIMDIGISIFITGLISIIITTFIYLFIIWLKIIWSAKP
jgi:hypothetical protein